MDGDTEDAIRMPINMGGYHVVVLYFFPSKLPFSINVCMLQQQCYRVFTVWRRYTQPIPHYGEACSLSTRNFVTSTMQRLLRNSGVVISTTQCHLSLTITLDLSFFFLHHWKQLQYLCPVGTTILDMF